MKVIAIKRMAYGSDGVGETWDETKIFEDTATLKEVLSFLQHPRKNIILSIAQE